MSPDSTAVERPIVQPKKRGGIFALSLLYLILEILSFWDGHTAITNAGLILLVCFTSLAAFQFASRIFDPVRAARRTAKMSALTRNRLSRANRILRIAGVIAVIVVGIAYFVSGRHLFHGWMIYLQPPVFIWPLAIADLIGEDPMDRRRATFGPRIDWVNLKPIHSDKWGQRA